MQKRIFVLIIAITLISGLSFFSSDSYAGSKNNFYNPNTGNKGSANSSSSSSSVPYQSRTVQIGNLSFTNADGDSKYRTDQTVSAANLPDRGQVTVTTHYQPGYNSVVTRDDTLRMSGGSNNTYLNFWRDTEKYGHTTVTTYQAENLKEWFSQNVKAQSAVQTTRSPVSKGNASTESASGASANRPKVDESRIGYQQARAAQNSGAKLIEAKVYSPFDHMFDRAGTSSFMDRAPQPGDTPLWSMSRDRNGQYREEGKIFDTFTADVDKVLPYYTIVLKYQTSRGQIITTAPYATKGWQIKDAFAPMIAPTDISDSRTLNNVLRAAQNDSLQRGEFTYVNVGARYGQYGPNGPPDTLKVVFHNGRFVGIVDYAYQRQSLQSLNALGRQVYVGSFTFNTREFTNALRFRNYDE
jgi:hypothetical protein